MLDADALAALCMAQPGFDPATFDVDAFVDGLDDASVARLVQPIVAQRERDKFGLWDRLFPDDGPLRRELYPRHIEFFNAGRDFMQRCFMAANRVGKTIAGGYEVTAHTTGIYPHWWEGRRFRKAGEWWVAGDTNETTRDILQKELLGPVIYRGPRKTVEGSGLIPAEKIGRITWKRGLDDTVDTVQIKHATGAWARIGFKSFEQGRKVFQGTKKQGIWLDEEPPMAIYNECLIRLATTGGVMLQTFTPLSGLSEVVLSFLGDDYRPGTRDDA